MLLANWLSKPKGDVYVLGWGEVEALNSNVCWFLWGKCSHHG